MAFLVTIEIIQESLLRLYKILIMILVQVLAFEGITTTITCIYFSQISALIYTIAEYTHISMVSQNLQTSVFLYHC